jgi:CheY-like chemotaxis protein
MPFTGFDPDVVVLDIAMPKLSGWEVARQGPARDRAVIRRMLIGVSGEYKNDVDRILSEIVGFDPLPAEAMQSERASRLARTAPHAASSPLVLPLRLALERPVGGRSEAALW